MLKNKIGKMLTASIMAATMLTTTAVSVVPTATSLVASAAGNYQVLGATDFDNGAGLPWHICESGTAKLDFDISGGSYNITIIKAGGQAQDGEDRWDCQFRHRGLKLKSGHTYKLSFDVNASNAGKLYTKIGNLDATSVGNATAGEFWHNGYSCWSGNDYNAKGWNPLEVKAGDNHFEFDAFTAGSDVEALEWTFHFGGGGDVTNTTGQLSFPEGTVLKFDNMSMTSDNQEDEYPKKEEYVRKGIAVNQVGYFTKLAKKATLAYDDESSYKSAAQDFEVVNESGKTVKTGKTTPVGFDKNSGDYVHTIDFSDVTTAGTYTIKCDGKESYAFTIGDDVYGKDADHANSLFTNAMNYFYQNRSGVAIEAKYITSGDTSSLAHQKGHDPDVAYIQNQWINQYKTDGTDVITDQGEVTATGGWYDAGDHGKYVVNGGISVWTLQNMYERAVVNNKADAWKTDAKKIVIPESGDSTPDILDETKLELDFFFDMIVADGKYKGLVYHKLHDYRWTGLAVRPNEDTYTRIVKPPTLAATLNTVACAAQAYRLWKDVDSTYANKCLDNAKSCYEAALKFKSVKCDDGSADAKMIYAPLDQAKGGGAYGDTDVQDDFYWAACELYAATGDKAYYTDLKGYEKAFVTEYDLSGGENNGSRTSFNWGNTAGLGNLTLSLYKGKMEESDYAKLKSSLTEAADVYIDLENKEGYGIPYEGTKFKDDVNAPGKEFDGYEWGSNSMVVNNAIVMAYAYDLTKDVKYINGASTAMDYIFGRNGGDYSYVTGYGEHATTNPHHRYWSHEVNEEFPLAPNGVLSGGPNKGMVDPYVRGAGLPADTPSQKCYIDSVEAWSVNECTINWNSPLVWMVSFLDDEAENVGDKPNPSESSSTEDTKPTGSTGDTSGTGDTGSSVNPGALSKCGDVNCDGDVDLQDLVSLAKYFADSNSYALSEEAMANADCNHDGSVGNPDAVNLLKFVSSQLTAKEFCPKHYK